MSIEFKNSQGPWLESTGSPDHVLLAQFINELLVGKAFDDNAAIQAVLATWPEFFQRKATGEERGLFKDVWISRDNRVVTDGGMGSGGLYLGSIGEKQAEESQQEA